MIKNTINYIQEKLELCNPEIAVILGSGLHGFAEELDNTKSLDYKDIPDFPQSTVAGHKGKLLKGYIGKKEIICLNGRFHLYEGHNPADITKVIRILKDLGVKQLIVTNASGSLRKEYVPGTLVLIKDHINFSGINPLVGPNDEKYGPRFPSVSRAYSVELRNKCKKIASNQGVSLLEGTYLMVLGPNFETAAEAKAFAVLGADIVGMSTVPEVLAAAHCSMNVLGLSVVTNYTAGVMDVESSHEETLKEAEKASATMVKLVKAFIKDN